MSYEAEQRAKADEERREGFEKFLENPLVRLATADIPPGAVSLKVVLRAAFDAGFASGATNTVMESMRAVFKAPPRPPGGEPR